jgi:hypothetical protein
MLSVARVEIHDRSYDELHPRMEDMHFFQKFVDSADGKRRHALPGMYVSTHYTSPQLALLSVTAAARQADIQAQIMLIAGDQILSYGCREEEPVSYAYLLADLARLTGTSAPKPMTVGEYLDALSSPSKGAGLGSVPSSTTMPVPFGLGEYFASLTSQCKGAALGSMQVPTSMPVPATPFFDALGKGK